MKSKSLLLLAMLAAAAATHAQNAPSKGISETTDPDKIAAIERRAHEIESKAQADSGSMSHKMAKKHPMKHKAKPAASTPSTHPKDMPASTG